MDLFEISNRVSKGGRRKIKMSLLEVNSINKNGINWKEEYVINNLDSAINMPLCAEFTDDTKTVPLGHGLTSIDKSENEPLFEDSEVVGTITKAYLTDIVVDGATKKILCGEGFIYQQRYPNFTKWLVDNVKNNKVMSSIEIMGTPENNNIIVYEEEEISQEKRTPCEFLFSGSALLSVEPADDMAMVLQMNSLNKNNTEESEEQEVMNEEMLNAITDTVKNTISEVNAKNAEYEAKIAELNQTIADKDNTISEINASVEQIKQALAELEAERDGLRAELDATYEAREILTAELAKAKVAEKIGEMEKAVAVFTEEQKAYAANEIEEFKANPETVEINTIVNKIYVEIGKKALTETPVVETNQKEDIYAGIDSVKEEKVIDVYASTIK